MSHSRALVTTSKWGTHYRHVRGNDINDWSGPYYSFEDMIYNPWDCGIWS